MKGKKKRKEEKSVPAEEIESRPEIRTRARDAGLFLAAVVLVALVVFHKILGPGSILFTTDDNIGIMALRKAAMPSSFFGWWNDAVLAGMPEPLSLNWTNLLLLLLPVRWFTNWIHAIDLVVASVLLALFLRERGRSWIACGLAALTACWVGTNFTLTYAGHIGKFGILVFVSMGLWLAEKAITRRSIRWAALAGGAFGAMFLEQADVALFFSMAVGPYVLYRLISEYGLKVKTLVRVLMPMAVLGALIAFRPLLGGYSIGAQSGATDEPEDPKAKWEFATQWSWPPEESVDFIAPGYTGWRSGEVSGP